MNLISFVLCIDRIEPHPVHPTETVVVHASGRAYESIGLNLPLSDRPAIGDLILVQIERRNGNKGDGPIGAPCDPAPHGQSGWVRR
jgi:hypothetical protein